MQFTPYLSFNGKCEAAFKHYEQCFGGKIASLVTFATTPMKDQVPPEWRNKICHATLLVGEGALMGADMTPERFEAVKGVSITFVPKSADEAKRVFDKLAENGTVSMPLQKTFWAAQFGMVVDQFGISWMVNLEAA
jgi:PhnB protein